MIIITTTMRSFIMLPMTITVLMIAEDGDRICAHLRVDVPDIDALAIIETRFVAAAGTDLEDWKAAACERARRMLAIA